MKPTRQGMFFFAALLGLFAEGLSHVLAWAAHLLKPRGRFVPGPIPRRIIDGRLVLDPRAGVAVIADLLRDLSGRFLDYGGAGYHVDHKLFGGRGGTGEDTDPDDTTALLAVIAHVNSIQNNPSNARRIVGSKIKLSPEKIYRCTETLYPFPGVSFVSGGRFSGKIQFEMTFQDDGVVYDVDTTGHTSWASFGWGSGLFGVTLSTKNYLVDGESCRTLLTFRGIMQAVCRDFTLIGAKFRLLHIENCVACSFGPGEIKLCDGRDQGYDEYDEYDDVEGCGVWGGGDFCTAMKFNEVYVNQINYGPCWDMGGEFHLDGCNAESAGMLDQAAGNGYRARFGHHTLENFRMEDIPTHGIVTGSEPNPGGGRTVVEIVNPMYYLGASWLADTAAIYVDQYSNTVNVRGGDVGVADYPVTVHPGALAGLNQVKIDNVDFGGGAKTLRVYDGVTDTSWRAYRNLSWEPNCRFRQVKDKGAIAPGGTAILDIPTRQDASPILRVRAEVYYQSSSDLRAIADIIIHREGDGRTDGTASVYIIHNDTGGSFTVAGGNFAVTYPSAGVTRITYTSANGANNNYVQFEVEGSGVVGDITIT